MIRAGGLILALTLVLANVAWTGQARAQEAAPSDVTAAPEDAADPIADLLQSLPPDQSTDEAEPEPEATAPATVDASVETAPFQPGVMPAQPLIAPQPVRPATPAYPTLDRPVMIGERDRTPDRPPTPLDLGYEARIRGSASSAQGLQGPLDGGWTVRAGDGTALYGLQLVDRGDYGPLEGAWRRLGGTGKVGLIDGLDRTGSVLTIRISHGYGKPPAVLTLTTAGGAEWSGDLTDETGSRPVTMKRN